MPNSDNLEPQYQAVWPADNTSGKELAVRQTAERARLAANDERAAAALQARLADMPQATADLAQRVAHCRRLRAEDRCPGRCVITGLPRSGPLGERGSDGLRRLR